MLLLLCVWCVCVSTLPVWQYCRCERVRTCSHLYLSQRDTWAAAGWCSMTNITISSSTLCCVSSSWTGRSGDLVCQSREVRGECWCWALGGLEHLRKEEEERPRSSNSNRQPTNSERESGASHVANMRATTPSRALPARVWPPLLALLFSSLPSRDHPPKTFFFTPPLLQVGGGHVTYGIIQIYDGGKLRTTLNAHTGNRRTHAPTLGHVRR